MSRGLGFVQMSVLRVLLAERRYRPRGGYDYTKTTTSLTELSRFEDLAGVHRTSIGRAVRRLEAAGYVHTDLPAFDHSLRATERRAKYVGLTRAGLEQIAQTRFKESARALMDELPDYTAAHLGTLNDAQLITQALGSLVKEMFDAANLQQEVRFGRTVDIRRTPDLYEWMNAVSAVGFDWEYWLDSLPR
jgi:DNA-binding MarR family transcriptional regulator